MDVASPQRGSRFRSDAKICRSEFFSGHIWGEETGPGCWHRPDWTLVSSFYNLISDVFIFLHRSSSGFLGSFKLTSIAKQLCPELSGSWSYMVIYLYCINKVHLWPELSCLSRYSSSLLPMFYLCWTPSVPPLHSLTQVIHLTVRRVWSLDLFAPHFNIQNV